MKNDYPSLRLVDRLRDLSYWPGLLQLKYSFRQLQALAHYREFQQLRHLLATLPLGALLESQPRFLYKFLGYYAANSFARPVRHAIILHHYRYLGARLQPDFFALVATRPVIWQQQAADADFSIRLSFPFKGWNEGELSLSFFRNDTLLQMLTFVIVPGAVVGAPAPHALLVCQVQGTRETESIRLATKALHDITPAHLLVHAAYGVAVALRIQHAAGVSTQERLRDGPKCHFDYDTFWQQFQGQRLANHLYLLDVEAPEKPLEEVKAKYRPRTLRKRYYKQLLRQAVAQHWQATYLPAPAQVPVGSALALA